MRAPHLVCRLVLGLTLVCLAVGCFGCIWLALVVDVEIVPAVEPLFAAPAAVEPRSLVPFGVEPEVRWQAAWKKVDELVGE
jgi:hypothetical protein